MEWNGEGSISKDQVECVTFGYCSLQIIRMLCQDVTDLFKVENVVSEDSSDRL